MLKNEKLQELNINILDNLIDDVYWGLKDECIDGFEQIFRDTVHEINGKKLTIYLLFQEKCKDKKIKDIKLEEFILDEDIKCGFELFLENLMDYSEEDSEEYQVADYLYELLEEYNI